MSDLADQLRADLVEKVGEVTGSPMVGSIILAYTWIDEDGQPQWNWIAAGDMTATNILGLSEGVRGHIHKRMFGTGE